jgi:hypothetical protein
MQFILNWTHHSIAVILNIVVKINLNSVIQQWTSSNNEWSIC